MKTRNAALLTTQRTHAHPHDAVNAPNPPQWYLVGGNLVYGVPAAAEPRA